LRSCFRRKFLVLLSTDSRKTMRRTFHSKNPLPSHAFPPHAVVNYDETRICIGSDGKMKVKRLVSKTKNKPQFCGGVKFTHAGTFLPFISATGEIVASYFILPSKFNENTTAEVSLTVPNVRRVTRSAPIPYKIIWTDKHPGFALETTWQHTSNLKSSRTAWRKRFL